MAEEGQEKRFLVLTVIRGHGGSAGHSSAWQRWFFVLVPLHRVTSGIEGHLGGTSSMGTWVMAREKRNRGSCPPPPSWCSSVPKTGVNG